MQLALKRVGKAFSLYVAALFVVVGFYAVLGQMGLAELGANAAFPFAQISNEREKTRLEIVATNAREIRAALAVPVAGPEPLGPVRNRAANAMGGPKGASKLAAREQKPKLSTEAKEAFASSSIDAPRGYETFDRHRPM
jgi:hypothetical protein